MLKKVYTSTTPMLPGFLQAILEDAGIPCTMRNYFGSGATGELPFTETWPALWVDEMHEAAALELIEQTLAGQQGASDWLCPKCGENVEGQFQACWQCGQAAPENQQVKLPEGESIAELREEGRR